MNNQITRINFYGGELEAIKDGENVWVSVRRCCESLGIDADAQQRKLRDTGRAPWACTAMMTVQVGGQGRSLFMLHLDSLPMWLVTIDTGRVSQDIRDLLVRYQKEAAQVLRDHFFGKGRGITLPDNLADALLMASEIERDRQRVATEKAAADEHIRAIMPAATYCHQGAQL
jgi:hypothetical protein